MWRRSKQYLRTNWGAPFIVAFIVLLISSAALLDTDRSSTANDVAVYAFYALVLGVVLQIASYIKFGESESSEQTSYTSSSWAPPRSWRPGRRTIAVVIVVIVIIASLGSVIYYKPSFSSHTTYTTATTQKTIGRLVAGVEFIVPNLLANNAVDLLIGINETGGLAPYNFTAYWSDGVNQTNNVGVFIRSFLSNQSVPSSLEVVVSSSDGQSVTVPVELPSVNRTTSTSTTSSSTTTVPIVTFVETGLSKGAVWTVTIPTNEFQTNSSQIVFNYYSGNITNYVVSGPYDTKNFAWAFIPTPESGTFEVNKTAVRISVSFYNESVFVPADQIFILTSPPAASSISTGSEELSFTYLNAFPDRVTAIVFASLRNTATGSVSVETATISPLASEEQTTNLVFSGISPGNYSANLFVESPGGVILSQSTNTTFTKG